MSTCPVQPATTSDLHYSRTSTTSSYPTLLSPALPASSPLRTLALRSPPTSWNLPLPLYRPRRLRLCVSSPCLLVSWAGTTGSRSKAYVPFSPVTVLSSNPSVYQNLDSVILSDDWCLPGPLITAPQSRVPSPAAALPVSADVQAILHLLQATIDQKGALMPILVCFLQLLHFFHRWAQFLPCSLCFPQQSTPTSCKGSAALTSMTKGLTTHPKPKSSHPMSTSPSTTTTYITIDSQSVSSIEVPLADDMESSDEEDEDVLEVEEVVR